LKVESIYEINFKFIFLLYFNGVGMHTMFFISYISGKAKATDKNSIIDAKRLVMYGGFFFSKGFIGMI